MGICLYWFLLIVVCFAPVSFLIDTLDKHSPHWIGVLAKVVGVVVAPILFGWVFYVLIGRRLKWHDLKSKMER